MKRRLIPIQDPVDFGAHLVTQLGRRGGTAFGLPLALGGVLLYGLPRLAARLGAPRRARLLRDGGRLLLGGAALDLGLTAAEAPLRLAYPPVRGTAFYWFAARVALATLGLLLALAGAPVVSDLSPGVLRRLRRLLAAAHTALTLFVVYATYIDGQRLRTATIPLAFPGRTPDAPPLRLRVAQLSDIHIERRVRREDAALARLRAARPDLILLTGDFINIDYYDARAYEALRAFLQDLAALQPPHGIYACRGNVDLPAITRATFLGTGVTLLEETAVTLDIAGRRVQLLGAGSSRGHRWEYDLPNFQAAVAAAARQGPADLRILLFHTPDLAPQAVAADIDLYVCGHTHGGQIRLPILGALRTGSRFGRRYVSGLHRLSHGGVLYTNRGLGFEGMDLPRLRVLCPPELALFDLSVGAPSLL